MRRLYRLLLKLYPPDFREQYGSGLERQFADEYRDAGGSGARFRYGLGALWDVAATVPVETVRELIQNLGFTMRVYRRRLAPTVLSLAAMALAIGSTTGIFSVLNAVLLDPLPFAGNDQLVYLFRYPIGAGTGQEEIREWVSTSTYLEDAAFSRISGRNLRTGSESVRVRICEGTVNFLPMLGVQPVVGRGFSPDEESLDNSRVAVIGYGLWQRLFGGDPAAIGTGIYLDERPFTVVGVAPPGLNYPNDAEVWTPSYYGAGLPARSYDYHYIGRLKPSVTLDQALLLVPGDIERILSRYPEQVRERERERYKEYPPELRSLREELAGPVGQASWVLMGTMALVLLIACGSLGHLLLSRVAERRQELSIRASLGASGARLARQLVTEALVLNCVAAIAGLGVARWVALLTAAAVPPELATVQYSVLDWRVFAFALGLASITGLVLGLVPFALIRRAGREGSLLRAQPGGRFETGGRARAALIVMQVAVTVALIAGSVSMGRSFLRLVGTDLGYNTHNVITLRTAVPRTRATSRSTTADFTRRTLERVRALPGVESAGAASYLPLAEIGLKQGTYFELIGDPPRMERQSADVVVTTPDFFRTMGTRLLAGREFLESDTGWRVTPQVVIVNDVFARRYPGVDLVGRELKLTPSGAKATIVGVVTSQRFEGPETDPWEIIYRPLYQSDQGAATFVVRTRGDPAPKVATVRQTVQDVDPTIPVYDVMTLDQRLSQTLSRPRFFAAGIAFLAGFALLVAAIGVYGAANRAVVQRTHEIGVRIAVGGQPSRIRTMIFGQSMIPIMIGGTAGLFGAMALSRYLRYLLESAEAIGPEISGAAFLVIAAAAAIAIWVATSRVVRTDATAVLRIN